MSGSDLPTADQLDSHVEAAFDFETARLVGRMIEAGKSAPPTDQVMRVAMMVARGKLRMQKKFPDAIQSSAI